MKPLLKITSIPISFELKIKNAHLEYSQGTAEVEITRDKGGGYRMKSHPIKVNIDTFEARNSVTPSTAQSVKQYAAKGKTAAYEATAQMAREGQLLVKAKIGDGVFKQIDAQRNAMPTGEFNLDFIPKAGADLTWSGPELTISYEMDKLNFDLKIANGNFEFIPGDIEISITQWPDVKIEYIGSPIYVPPSAGERYESLDIRA